MVSRASRTSSARGAGQPAIHTALRAPAPPAVDATSTATAQALALHPACCTPSRQQQLWLHSTCARDTKRPHQERRSEASASAPSPPRSRAATRSGGPEKTRQQYRLTTGTARSTHTLPLHTGGPGEPAQAHQCPPQSHAKGMDVKRESITQSCAPTAPTATGERSHFTCSTPSLPLHTGRPVEPAQAHQCPPQGLSLIHI